MRPRSSADGLRDVLQQVADGRLTVDEAADQIRALRPRQFVSPMLVGRVFAIIGGTFLLIGLGFAAYSAVFAANAKSTEGEVIEMVGGSRKSPIVEYDVDGQRFTFQSSIATSPPAYAVGDKVTVLYQPDNPGRAQIDSFVGRWLFAAIFGGIGCGFLMLALFVPAVSRLFAGNAT